MMDRTSVERILTEAREAVEAAKLPADLRALAYEKAVSLLAGTAPAPGDTAGDGNGAKESGTDTSGGGTTGGRVGKVAKRLNVDAPKLAYVFDLDDEEDVTLVVPRSKLAPSKADATREVARLYSAARQAGGYDETHTSVAKIRARVDDMGVLDSNNFASHVKSIEGMSVKGSSAQTREFKMTQHGYEETAKLIEQIVQRITGGNGS